MKLKFSRQIFEKYSNIKFHENPSNGSRVVPYGDEGKNSFSQFCGKRLNANQLMLYREIIAVCSQIHTKHINTLCGQNVEFVKVKLGGTYSDHWSHLYIKIQSVPRSKHTPSRL